MSIKYEPKHVCDFCGKEATTLVVGISGLDHSPPAEICPKCVKLAADATVADGASNGPIKHPKSAEYEAIERTEKAAAYMRESAAQAQNIYGSQANNAYNLNNSGQSHGPGVFDPFEGS